MTRDQKEIKILTLEESFSVKWKFFEFWARRKPFSDVSQAQCQEEALLN